MRRFLGIPYQDHGRTKRGLDCWGLCVLVAKEVYDYELPSLNKMYSSAGNGADVSELVEVEKLSKWDKVSDYKAGDICVFNIGGLSSHVGTYIENNKFIHILQGSEVTIEDLDSILWTNRLNGVYRRCKV